MKDRSCIKIKRVIDLSQPMYIENFSNPAFPPMKNEIYTNWDNDGWLTEIVTMATHLGTHIDAPAHRFEKGKKIDEYSLDRFQGEAVVIDLFNQKSASEITVEQLYKYEKKIKPDDIVLLCTGWGQKKNAGNEEEYKHNSPWLGESASRYLIEKKVKAVGIDHFSIGGTDPKHVKVPHELLLKNDILIFEDLLLPKILLEKERWYIVAFPILLGNTSGSFARVVALDL